MLPGAEPFSHTGSRLGALVLHGFTGNPSSVRVLADAFAAEGWSVEMPRLPGHGTTIEDMLDTRFDDWAAETEAAYQRLAARCDKVVVTGLSMGGALTMWLGMEHPEITALVCINAPIAMDPELEAMVDDLIAAGETLLPGIGSDIAKEGVVETAYAETPLLALKSLADTSAECRPRLGEIECPVLVLVSENDHVVSPTNSDIIAAELGGPVERASYPLSYHVITMDHEADAVTKRTLEFARKVTA